MKPKYDAITIPEHRKYWPPTLSNFRGILLPVQDMRNRFSFELEKGARRKIRLFPSAWSTYASKHWAPRGSEHTRALGERIVIRKSHKRHPTCDLAFQAW